MTFHIDKALRGPIAGYNSADGAKKKLVHDLLLTDKGFSSLGMSEKLDVLDGLDYHQNEMDTEKGGVFPATIKRVDVFERSFTDDAGNKVVNGQKARIVFDGKDEEGEISEQFIDTNWISKNIPAKYDDPQDLYQSGFFSLSLANTIKEIAEDNIGQKVLIRKVNPSGTVKNAKGKQVRVRYCADITPPAGSDSPVAKVMRILRNLGIDPDQDDFTQLSKVADTAKDNSDTLHETLVNLLRGAGMDTPAVGDDTDEMMTAELYIKAFYEE